MLPDIDGTLPFIVFCAAVFVAIPIPPCPPAKLVLYADAPPFPPDTVVLYEAEVLLTPLLPPFDVTTTPLPIVEQLTLL